MKKQHIKFPSIGQYKNVIKEVQHLARYAGVDENGEVILTTDRRTYKTLMDEIDINRNLLEDAISKETDPEKRAELNLQLSKINQYEKGIQKPETALNAAMYGFTEVLKENVIENYGGQLANKIINNSK